MNNLNQKRVIVLGVHRSGTSLLAELAHRWGAHGGPPENLYPANEWNPRGYWEFVPLINFNNNLLKAVKGHGWCPPADEADGLLAAHAESGSFRDQALGLLASMDECGRPWFWKDPRLAVLLPFWKRLWGEAVYLIAVRNPLDVANSLASRDVGASLSAALLLWQTYVARILCGTAGDRNRLFVEYESLLTDSPQQVSRFCGFLNRQMGVQGNDVQHVMEAADPSLRRHVSDRESVGASSIVTDRQKELYAVVRRLADDPEAQVPATSLLLPEKWRAYLSDPREEVPHS